MYIKTLSLLSLLSISILSCSNEAGNVSLFNANKEELIQAQAGGKPALIKKNNNGFLVLKNTYNQKIILDLYGSNGSKWKSFKFNDGFSDDDINPYAMKPENILLVFRYLGKENGFYKVVVNEDNNTTKYIKESDSNFKYQTVEEHILTVFSIGSSEKNNPLRSKPNDKSKEILYNKNSFYYPIKINGNWLMVEDDNKETFWIKCCDKKGNLILDLYYDA